MRAEESASNGDLAEAIADASRRLAQAGVPSPRTDAELLAAHLLKMSPGELRAAAIRGAAVPAGYDDLVAERARRVPLQHLTGEVDFCGVRLSVGPGVFVPRPETELVAACARDAALDIAPDGAALIVDLCTGSGAIAAALAAWLPQARVHAVELDPLAAAWAARNLAGSDVELHVADAADALPGFDAAVDVVVSNPPYIPPDMRPVDPEVLEHDPQIALFGGGADGLDVPRAVIASAARLLRPGGVFVMEHAEVQAAAVRRAVAAAGAFEEVETHRDLAGRPRFVRARRFAI